jgi:hypothetical protein
MMGLNVERTAIEWFEEAVRCYVEEHQGCASCSERHCVFRSYHGHRIEFYCHVCDFSVGHDTISGAYFAAPGEGPCRPDAIFANAPLGAQE